MNDENGAQAACEWLAVRIVVLGGFAIAILVAAYMGWSRYETARSDDAQRAQLQATASSIAAKNEKTLEAERKRVGTMLCLRVLINAQTIGIVPVYGRLTKDMPHMIGSAGRYACSAGTSAAQYTVTGDLKCMDMRDAKCVGLVSVKLDDGTVLYNAPK